VPAFTAAFTGVIPEVQRKLMERKIKILFISLLFLKLHVISSDFGPKP
jgi:hypothetical protein